MHYVVRMESSAVAEGVVVQPVLNVSTRSMVTAVLWVKMSVGLALRPVMFPVLLPGPLNARIPILMEPQCITGAVRLGRSVRIAALASV